MNDQQSYEKRLAEKFQQLPLPDVEPGWQQMKAILDKEMPRGGGYWKWVTGIGVILLLFSGTWIVINHKNRAQDIAVQKEGLIKPKITADTLSNNGSTRLDDHTQKQKNTSAKKHSTSINKNDQLVDESKKTSIHEENLHNKINTLSPEISDKSGKQNNTAMGKKSRINKENEKWLAEENRGKKSLDKSNRNNIPVTVSTGNKTKQFIEKGFIDRQKQLPDELVLRHLPSAVERQHIALSIGVAATIRDSIDQQYYLNTFLRNVSETQKTGKQSKTQPGKSKEIFAGENKNMAFGFSLPLGFPLGDQKPGAYNINAKPNTVSDFIPVPHLQYHINNKVYLQTELQLMNPQFIQPVLLYQDKRQVTATNSVHYNSIYARKLYYFNIPLGIHYSPFQHFFLGTGLQFSSLLSGVALQEETSTVIGSGRSYVVNQRYTKFKNDTLSRKIDENEFRLMLDANYYWKKFTVGLRYNQAFSNYVSLRVNTSSSLFQDKNKSLQFYLRYNLWENQKKTSSVVNLYQRNLK